MTNFLRGSLLTMGLLTALSTVAATEAKGQNVLGEILRRMNNHNKTLQTLVSPITMVKYDSVLKTRDTKVGTLSLVPKSAKQALLFRLDWETENGRPRGETLALADGVFKIYKHGANEVMVGKPGGVKDPVSGGGALSFMSMSKEQLSSSFDIAYIGEEKIDGKTITWHLEMTPKISMGYKSADVWVDANGMVLQARRVERNNDTTTILLHEPKKNVTVQKAFFKPKFPGTRELKI